MPIFMILGRVIQWVSAGLIAKWVIAFGVGWMVVTGMDVLFDWLFAQIQSNLSAGGPQVTAIFGMLRIDDAIQIIFGAWGVRLALAAYNGAGGIKKLVFGQAAGGG